eukprot:m.295122 g.295122  ORF g.295122 m.295122 type:complete len:127 (-) comp27171_c0_seq1:12-392(-)
MATDECGEESQLVSPCVDIRCGRVSKEVANHRVAERSQGVETTAALSIGEALGGCGARCYAGGDSGGARCGGTCNHHTKRQGESEDRVHVLWFAGLETVSPAGIAWKGWEATSNGALRAALSASLS